MIVSGGENVYPQELEEQLILHPEIEDFAVLSVRDEEFGQRLAAVVVRRSDSPLEESDVAAWLEGRVERFKKPKWIRLVKRIPRNPLGKLEKTTLLEQLGEH
jgi:fatty-acyl-CoA synthase